ncbi:hypothetical protein PROVRETT_10078 [Providencia rettgeri DSM 1131]|nr:hypothetical protein PROVRETT_10078 [Providencia rettgeri DSM 1131]
MVFNLPILLGKSKYHPESIHAIIIGVLVQKSALNKNTIQA